MAKYYVVTEVDDEATLDHFIKSDDTRAIYRRPTTFCTCEIGSRKKGGGWTRGKKYGWWVCAVCKKPSSYVHAEDNILMAGPFGFNLLEALRQS